MRIRSLLGILLVVVAAFAWPGRAQAAAPYEGKVVTIVVPFSVGGGYDRVARLVARHLPKYLPGQPRVVVQNMPGGGGLVGVNHLYNTAAPDGLTIGVVPRNVGFAQMLGASGVKFDLRRFAWIGSVASEPSVLVVRSDLPIQTFADLRRAEREVILGSTGPGDTSHDYALILKEYLGARIRLVSGYKGVSDVMLAVERGEVDGLASSYGGLKPHIERGVIRAILRSRGTSAGIEQLPSDESLADSPLAKTILALRANTEVAGRPFAAPPGTPAEYVGRLRDALARVASDPEAMAEAEKSRLDLHWVSGPELESLIGEALRQPPEIIRELSKSITYGG